MEENPPENLMTWHEATEYAKTLGDGWRLPTIEELKYAYDNKLKGFTHFNYWSSTIHTTDASLVWCVNFFFGYVDYVFSVSKYNIRLRGEYYE